MNRPVASVASRIAIVVGLPLLLALACAGEPAADAAAYIQELELYRADREERLRGERGWLTLIGLFWLDEGRNRFGTAADAEIVLPVGPELAGSFLHDEEGLRVAAAPGAGLTLDGEPLSADESPLEPDVSVIALDRLTLYPIARGGRMAIRVKDPRSPVRAAFQGLEFYPPDPGMRIEARLERYDRPVERAVPTVVGTTASMQAPGRVVFDLDGQTHSLEAFESDPDLLFIIFRDATSGRTTYGAGRYLYAGLDGDRVDLDLNKAYNPPCAFTPYATCALPPPGNRLEVAVEVGEKAYAAHP